MTHAEIPHHLVSGPGRKPGTTILHARVKARPSKDGTHLRSGGRSEAWTQHGAGRHHAGLEITPERHHQLARQRHDGDAAHPPLDVGDTLAEPTAAVAAGLVR